MDDSAKVTDSRFLIETLFYDERYQIHGYQGPLLRCLDSIEAQDGIIISINRTDTENMIRHEIIWKKSSGR